MKCDQPPPNHAPLVEGRCPECRKSVSWEGRFGDHNVPHFFRDPRRPLRHLSDTQFHGDFYTGE